LPFPLLSIMLVCMDISLLRDREGFRRHVIDALARETLDYLAQFQFLDNHRKSRESWNGGGVLLPLYFQEKKKSGEKDGGEYVFLLNKRSRSVQQPGDLCAPGGGIHPFLDSLSQKVLQFGLLPGVGGPGLERAKDRGKGTYQKILFILGNALRESWEELRLSPFNVEFLGPLPTYCLHSRRWIIFPLVGEVKRPWKFKFSWEVEKIVPIPLEAFFHPENYAVYSLEVPEKLIAAGIPNPWEFPCLVYPENGEEEILWGATFKVIQTFFKIGFDFQFPFPDGKKVVHRPLALNYLSGREDP
jgi:8-oxo-dGTP pyrophosphatase MutT (NUDIX family)